MSRIPRWIQELFPDIREEAAREGRVASLWYRLRAHHGPSRAAAIMEGKDPATEADIAAWNRLGIQNETDPDSK